MSTLFKSAIYVNASSNRLRAASRGSEPSLPLSEKKRWTSGQKLLAEARSRGEELPLIFAQYAPLTFWAVAREITLHQGATEYQFSDLRPLHGYRRSDLAVVKTGAPLPDEFIRSYAVVQTPEFMSAPLSEQATNILQALVNQIRHGRFTPDVPESYLGYKEIHGLLKLQRVGPHWGRSLRQQGLADLAHWINRTGLPAITGLIIDQTTFEPGEGYFEVYGRVPDDRTWWSEQIRSAIAFDWSDYVHDDPLPSLDELLAFSNAVLEGTLSTTSVEVRIRCEALRRRARQFYRDPDGKLRCEVCRWFKPDNRILGDIVELHHLRPLSDQPPEGMRLFLQDAIRGLVPLCPCCHRIAHSKLGGGGFTLDELKALVPKYAVS